MEYGDVYLMVEGDFLVSDSGDIVVVGGDVDVSINDLDVDLSFGIADTLIYQKMMRLLITVPGTYLWHPDWGVGIQQYVGKPMDGSTLREIKARIETNVLKMEEIEDVLATVSIFGFRGIAVAVEYSRVSGQGRKFSFTLSPKLGENS